MFPLLWLPQRNALQTSMDWRWGALRGLSKTAIIRLDLLGLLGSTPRFLAKQSPTSQAARLARSAPVRCGVDDSGCRPPAYFAEGLHHTYVSCAFPSSCDTVQKHRWYHWTCDILIICTSNHVSNKTQNCKTRIGFSVVTSCFWCSPSKEYASFHLKPSQSCPCPRLPRIKYAKFVLKPKFCKNPNWYSIITKLAQAQVLCALSTSILWNLGPVHELSTLFFEVFKDLGFIEVLFHSN